MPTLVNSITGESYRGLTGHAGAFNLRHHRVSHPFQNRYKSIVVVLRHKGGDAVFRCHRSVFSA